MTEREWEDICDGCAGCCTIGRGIACQYLDENNRCTTYKTRTQKEMCVKLTPKNIAMHHHNGVLPDTCAYVRAMQGLPAVKVTYKFVPFFLASDEIRSTHFKKLKNELKFRLGDDTDG